MFEKKREANLNKKEDRILVKFQDPDKKQFFNLLEEVKKLKDPSFVRETKEWSLKLDRFNVSRLKELGFNFSFDTEYYTKKAEESYKPSFPEINQTPLEGLYPFQKSAVRFFEGRNGNALLADEMGLGKSISALGWLKLHKENRPVLIVCPSSVKLNWPEEVEKWLGEDYKIINGTKPYDLPKKSFYIINYDIIKDWEETLSNMEINTIIIDEVQRISNTNTKRTKATIRIAKKIKNKLLLSGTPVRNRPKDFFTALNLIEPDRFKSRWYYLKRYCDAKHNGFGWEFKGATNIDELREKVAPIMYRREKKEVLKDLPEKQRTIAKLETNKKPQTNNLQSEVEDMIEQGVSKLQIRSKIEQIKGECYRARREETLKWIEEYINENGKLVVFAIHTSVIEDVLDRFKNIAVRYDGKVGQQEKQNAKEKFQNDPNTKLFVGQLQAAGEGITLTAASAVAFLEFGWVPAEHEQAEDRIHRIGQKADSVFAYYLCAGDSIEKDLIERLIEKKKVTSKLISGREKDLFKKEVLDKAF